jgi:hypothetical protein
MTSQHFYARQVFVGVPCLDCGSLLKNEVMSKMRAFVSLDSYWSLFMWTAKSGADVCCAANGVMPQHYRCCAFRSEWTGFR